MPTTFSREIKNYLNYSLYEDKQVSVFVIFTLEKKRLFPVEQFSPALKHES